MNPGFDFGGEGRGENLQLAYLLPQWHLWACMFPGVPAGVESWDNGVSVEEEEERRRSERRR